MVRPLSRSSTTLWLALVALVAMVAGGQFGLIRAAAQLVQAGTWVQTGDLQQARARSAATLLMDGRVLVSGGLVGGKATDSAERYDVSLGGFLAAGKMATARESHTATLLATGQVLVVGGLDDKGVPVAAAEIYTPATNKWAAAAPLTQARAGHTATRLANGKVVIVGGEGAGGPLASIEIFDPTTGTFRPAGGTLSAARTGHGTALLASGELLVVGGFDGTNLLASTDFYNPTTSVVRTGPSLQSARAGHSVTTLLDGRVLVAGGAGEQSELSSAELYNPAQGTFGVAGSQMVAARQRHQAILLPHNNQVLLVGGSAAGDAVGMVEVYVPWLGAGAFQATSPSVVPHLSGASAALSFNADLAVRSGPTDGLLLLAGGSDKADAKKQGRSAELYGFATIRTDKSDYPPGQTVYITGGGWVPGETVTLRLDEEPWRDTHTLAPVVADANGNIFSSEFVPDADDLGVTFYLTASGLRAQAQTVFTDATDSWTITGATVDGASSTTVAPGATITAEVTASLTGLSANWQATKWWISSSAPTFATAGSFCDDHTDASTGTGVTRSLTGATVPTTPGTYNVYFAVATGNSCSSQSSAIFTLSSAVVVGNGRYAVANGDWNATSTWASTSGGAAGASVPVAGDFVFIAEASTSRTVTIPASYAAAARSIVIGSQTSAAAGVLTFTDATSTLSTSGNVSMNRPNAAATSTIGIGAGSMSVGGALSLTNYSANASHNDRLNTITLSTGTVTIAGDLVFNAQGSALQSQIVFSGAGTVTVGGAFTLTNSLGTLTPSTGTVSFNGTAAQTIPIGVSSVTYHNLTVNNTNASGATLSAAVTATNVTGHLTVGTGSNAAILNNGGFAVTLASAKNFSVANGARFNLTGTSTTPTVAGGGTKTFGATSTVDYGGGAQTVSSDTYGNLRLSGSGNKTLGATATVAGNVDISGTAKFNLNYASGSSSAVGSVSFAGVQQVAGSWGSTTSSATNKTDTYFQGTGKVTASAGASLLIVTLPGETFVSGTGNTGSPTARTAGTAFSITLRVVNSGTNAIDTSYSGLKTVSYTGPGTAPNAATPTYTTAVTFVSGQATALSTTLVKAETTSITPAISDVSAAPSSSVTVDAGAGASLVVTTQPPSLTDPSTAFSPQPVIKILDALQNIVTTGADSTRVVTASLTSGSGTLGGTVTKTAVAGVADFAGNGLNIDTGGSGKVLTFSTTGGVITSVTSNAFSIGRLRYAVASGNWNVTSTWASTSGGSAGASVPVAGDQVFIAEGANSRTVTIPDGYVAAAGAVTIGTTTDNSVGVLNFATSTSSLSIGGNLTMNTPSSGATSTIGLGAGTLTVQGDVELARHTSAANQNNKITSITVSTGTLTIGGGLIFGAEDTGGLQSQIVFSGAGALNLAGAFTLTNGYGVLTPSSGTVNFNGAVAQTIPLTTTVKYNNLTVNNTHASGATLGAAVTATLVTGNITIGNGSNAAVLKNGGFAMTLASTKTFSVANGATFNLTGTSTMPTVSGVGGARTLGATSTVNYAGAAQAVTADTYGHLTLSGTGTKTLATPATVAGTLNIGSGAPLNLTYTDVGGTSTANALRFAGVLQAAASWGSTSSTATNTNNTYFVSGTGTGKINASTGTASKLGFTVQPSTTAAGSSISPSVVVAVQDANGNTVPTDNSTQITLAFGTNAGAGTLSGTLTRTVASGLATFNDVSINKVGTGYTLSASSSPAYTGATSTTFNITPGAATQLAFDQQPSTVKAGDAITPAVTVRILDANGNLVTTDTRNVSLAIGTNPSSGTLTGGSATAAVAGVATFSGLSINNPGVGYTLSASSSLPTGATSNTFTVSAAASFSPSPLAFGPRLVSPSTTLPARLTYEGSGTMAISAVSITAGGANYAVPAVNTCTSLAAGASCDISVTFTPGTGFETNYPGTLQVTSDKGTLELTLSGSRTSFQPLSFDVGPVKVGTTSSEKTFKFWNVGSTNIVTGAAAVSIPAPFAVTSDTCSSRTIVPLSSSVSTDPNTYCTVTVTYAPAVANLPATPGAVNTIMTVQGASPAFAYQVRVKATPTFAMTVSPSSLAFGNVPTGNASPSQAVTLTNPNGTAITISSIATGSASYATTNTCSGSVPANGSCTINVTFTPASATSLPATLTITSNAEFSPHTVAMTGTGVTAGDLTLSTSSLSFGSVAAGVTSAVQTVTISNGNNAAIPISDIALTGDFARSGGTCTTSVPGSGACTIGVTFTPTTSGARSGTLTITSAATGSPHQVSLGGTGTIAVLTLSTTAISDFGSVPVGATSGVRSVTVFNSNAIAVAIGTLTFPTDYARSGGTCASSVAANASCTIGYVLTPTAGGARTGSATIPNGAGSALSIAFSGTGTVPVGTTGSLGFSNVPVGSTGTLPVTLTNATSAPTTITGITFVGSNPGDFSADASVCSGTVPANGTCVVTVSFSPTATGTRGATMKVASAYSAATADTTVFGVGVSNPALSVSPNTLGFGTRTIASTTVLTTTVTNPNGVTVTGLSIGITGSDFSLAPAGTCTSTLAPGATCTISVTFVPSSKGNKSGSVTVSWDSMASAKTVSLTGKVN